MINRSGYLVFLANLGLEKKVDDAKDL